MKIGMIIGLLLVGPVFIGPAFASAQPAVILTFDDNWYGQLKYAVPILEKYNMTGTFYVVCDAATRADTNEKAHAQYMNWDEIRQVKEKGFDIQAHSMTHVDHQKLSAEGLAYEVGESKKCINEKLGSRDVHIYALPYGSGAFNATVTKEIEKWYNVSRDGYSNTTYLGCDGWYVAEKNQPPDCSVWLPNGQVKFAHKLNLRSVSMNDFDKNHNHSAQAILQDFKTLIHKNIRYDEAGKLEAIPILIWHNFGPLEETRERWQKTTTTPESFEAQMKFLHDAGIRTLAMNDLRYDNKTNHFYIPN